jgi:hypothetical protein
MTVIRKQGHNRKHAGGGANITLDTYLTSTLDIRSAYLHAAEVHRSTRRCPARRCNATIPCPDHGVPAEDRGEWLWQGRAAS